MRRSCLVLFRLTLVIGALTSTQAAWSEFRVAPYLQNVTRDEISVVWWSPDKMPGSLEWGLTKGYGQELASSPQEARAVTLVGPGPEGRGLLPVRHEVRLTGLKRNASYFYRVTQGAATWTAQFSTAPDTETPFTFVVAADPEAKATEPRRNRIHRAILDQIATKEPRFLLYAGDLVDEGNAQDDWDSFWSDLVRATPAESLASSIPVYPALGNHDYDGLNATLGGNKVPYAQPHAEAGVAKYLEYFTLPPNDRPAGDSRSERYYSFRHGPVTIVVLDANNDSLSTDDPATNWDTGRWRKHPLVGESEPPEPGGQGLAPDLHGGLPDREDSAQYGWLVQTLRQASRESAFVFVVTHQAPYSSFVHGDPGEQQSGHPLRKLDPLFHQYGVTAVFSGHDEAYERSVTVGGPDGKHEIHYFVLPTAGDPTGLRRPLPDATWQQGFSRFVYPLDNRHHGYLSVRIEPAGSDLFRATVTPNYLDEARPSDADPHYDDVVTLTGRTPR